MAKSDWKYSSPRCYSRRSGEMTAVIQMQGGDAWGRTWAELDVYKTIHFDGGCEFKGILFGEKFDTFEDAEKEALYYVG